MEPRYVAARTETMLPKRVWLRRDDVEPNDTAPLTEQRPPMYDAPNALENSAAVDSVVRRKARS